MSSIIPNSGTSKKEVFPLFAHEEQKLLTVFFAFINIVTPLIFITEFFVNGLLRPGYSPITQPISDLELGPLGWTQKLTFVTCGLLFIIANVGIYRALYPILGKIRSRISLVLMIISGCGLVLGGFFTEDAAGHQVLWHSFIHILGFHMLFDLLSIAMFIIGLGLLKEVKWRKFGWYSLATGLITLLLIFGPYFYKHGNWTASFGGVLQRSLEIEAFLWYVILGVTQLKQTRE